MFQARGDAIINVFFILDLNSKAELGDVVTIPGIDKQWKSLGVALGIRREQLDGIEAKHKKVIRCKREMFKLAVKEEVTWNQIIAGLTSIGMKSVIADVCKMFDIPLEDLVSAKSSKVSFMYCELLLYL